MNKPLLFAFALISLSTFPQALSMESLDIAIRIDQQGNGYITENYMLQFSSPFEFEQFKQSAQENSSSLLSWQADYDFFYTHFVTEAGTRLNSSSITFDEQRKVLTLEYDFKDRFATLIKQEQRTDLYRIDDTKFASFNSAGTIVIPEDTTIRIRVPSNAEIDLDKLPQNVQLANGNQIVLSGIQSNSIDIEFRVLKPIAPSGNIIPGVSNVYLTIPILITALILLYTKKEGIEKKIEDYLVEHSEIKSRQPEEELDLDIEK